MCGHATVNDIDRLRRLGIDHRGVVSEKEKIDLYSRAKVIAFPLIIEGFCMAVAEALYAQLYVVAWKIPVFDELYSHRCSQNIKLIEPKNYGDFAEQALLLTKAHVKKLHQHDSTTHAKLATEWEQVGEKVLLSIRDLIDQPMDKLE